MMRDSENNIQEILEQSAPRLNDSERVVLWARIEEALPRREPIRSPFSFLIHHTRSAVSLSLIALLILSSGGTVLAANTARPGDTLFPMKRALEDVARTIAPTETLRTSIETAQRTERIEELRAVLDETSTLVAGESTRRQLRPETGARIETSLDAIVDFFNATNMSEDERTHMLKAVFQEIDTLALDIIVDARTTGHTDAPRTIIEQDRGEKSRIKVRTDTKHVRIEHARDTVIITEDVDDDTKRDDSVDNHKTDNRDETELHDESATRTDDDSQSDDWNSSQTTDDENDTVDDYDAREASTRTENREEGTTTGPLTKIEARAQNGRAEVRAERGKERDEFELPFTSRATLVAALAARFDLEPENVEDVLDLEVE